MPNRVKANGHQSRLRARRLTRKYGAGIRTEYGLSSADDNIDISEKRKRNNLIFEKWKFGKKKTQLAREFKISPERVRQILAKYV